MLQRFQKSNLKIKSHNIAPYCSRQAILCVDTVSFCSFLKDIISSFLNQTHVFLKFDQFAVYWYADHSNPSSGYKVKVVWITQPLKPKVSNLSSLSMHVFIHRTVNKWRKKVIEKKLDFKKMISIIRHFREWQWNRKRLIAVVTAISSHDRRAAPPNGYCQAMDYLCRYGAPHLLQGSAQLCQVG